MWRYVRRQGQRGLLSVYECPGLENLRGGADSRLLCVSVILCNADGLRQSAAATIRKRIALPLREARKVAVFPAVISSAKLLLDLDAASLTPGNRRKPNASAKGEGARLQHGDGRRILRAGAVTNLRRKPGGSIVKSKPVMSASLSDIREDTIVLTGSMSLVATALFGDSERLMKFLQTNIPASAVAADQRYRKWVFALSKTGPLKLAQQLAVEQEDADEEKIACVFPKRIPSWRAHWRGDRAYLIHLDFVPRLLSAFKAPGTIRLIKDPSLRFDPGIPWEVTLEGGEKLTAVWRDTNARPAREVKLLQNGAGWTIAGDEPEENASIGLDHDGIDAWLGQFLRPAG